MNIDANEVLSQLGDAPAGAHVEGAVVHHLQRIDNAVRLIAVVVVVPVVLKLGLAVVGTAVAASYVARHGRKGLPMLQRELGIETGTRHSTAARHSSVPA